MAKKSQRPSVRNMRRICMSCGRTYTKKSTASNAYCPTCQKAMGVGDGLFYA